MGGDTYTVAALRDVSDRVEAEDHLHRVLHTLDASDDAVFIFDAESLRYSYVNDGAVRLVGYGRDELLAMTPLHLNPNATEADYRRLIETLLVNPDHAVMHEAILVAKDGHEIPVEKTFQSAPLGRGDTRWVVVLARDISERLAAEQELRRSQDALREAEQVLVLADDRERIARDLHDTVIQRLFGAGLQLQATSSSTDDAHPRAAPGDDHRSRRDDQGAPVGHLRPAGPGAWPPWPAGPPGRRHRRSRCRTRVRTPHPVRRTDRDHGRAGRRAPRSRAPRGGHQRGSSRRGRAPPDLDLARRRRRRAGRGRRRQGRARRGRRWPRPHQPGQPGRGARGHVPGRPVPRRAAPALEWRVPAVTERLVEG